MINYFKAFILLNAVGTLFAMPLSIGLLVSMGRAFSEGRWARLMLAYFLLLIAIAAILWFTRKMIPDGNTNSGRNAYFRTAIVMCMLLGVAALGTPSTGIDTNRNTVNFVTNISYAVSMPISAAVLIWLSPKLKSLAGQKPRT